MKVLLDSCIWGGAQKDLAAAGHEVDWVGRWDADPGDEEILARAASEGAILVTLDKDFGELAIVRGQVHTGIIRLANMSAREQGPTCAKVLARFARELEAGAVLTVKSGRVRVRPGSPSSR